MTAALFARPEAWPLLFLAPAAVVLFVGLERRRAGRLRRFVGPRWTALVSSPAGPRRLRRHLLLGATLLGVSLGALHPVWGQDAAALEGQGGDLVVALDVSRSMSARDVAPDRAGRARAELGALVERARGDRFGLVAFAGEARLVVPLTRDGRSFVDLLGPVGPTTVARGGTDLGAALVGALALLDPASTAPASILLVTDGEDHEGRGAAAAAACAARGVPVHVAAVGTTMGGKIVTRSASGESFLRGPSGEVVVSAMDPTGLRALAAATGGEFVELGADAGALVAFYERVIAPRARRAVASASRRTQENRYRWFLLPALLLGLLDLGWATHGARRTSHRGVAPRGRVRAALTAGLALFLVGCGGGEAAFEGRLDEARQALRGGGLDVADAALRDVAARAPEGVAWRAGFLRGNVAFARSEAAEAAAEVPGAPPTVLEGALAHAEDALAHWRRAAQREGVGPAAARNVERALLRVEALRARLSRRAPPEAPRPPPPPPPPRPAPRTVPTPAPGEPVEAPPGREAGVRALSRAEVLRVLEVLAEQERAKHDAREARRARPTSGVERDW